ncbi:hypothetical protein [Streptomyces stelliscabiei]|uniref:hypothetical protein n=1 Tax=Streptomyces stelliscabiei TaxID=146820 RepID=UPI002FF3A9A0
MPEDTPQGEEQPTMLSFTEAAERLVKDRIAPNMTAEGLRRLARDPKSGWPIGPGDYRVVGKTRTLPYDVLAEYMRERIGKRRGRGPDTKKRGKRTQQQGDPAVIQEQVTKPDYLTDEQWSAFVFGVLAGVVKGALEAGVNAGWGTDLATAAVKGARARLDELAAEEASDLE